MCIRDRDKTGETVESDKNKDGVGSLLNILKGGSQKKDSTTTATPSPATETQQQSSGDKIKEGIGNALKGILNGKGSNESKSLPVYYTNLLPAWDSSGV